MSISGRPALVVLKFMVLFCAMYAAFYLFRGGPVERLVIHDATVAPAAYLIGKLLSDQSVRASGNRIVSSRGSLTVRSGCEGTETLYLLIAGIVAVSARLRAKLGGILCGTALVFVLNQARLAALFVASRHAPGLFAPLHGYVAPTLMVLAVAGYFIWWTGRAGGDAPTGAPA